MTTMRIWAALGLLACTAGDDGDSVQPGPTDSPDTTASTGDTATGLTPLPELLTAELTLPGEGVRLARRLVVTSSAPTSAVLTITDSVDARTVVFPGEAARHDLPVLGLRPDEETEVAIELFSNGVSVGSEQWSVVASLEDVEMPTSVVHTARVPSDPMALTWCPLSQLGRARLVAYDEAGVPRWVQVRDRKCTSLTPGPGTLTLLQREVIQEIDRLGVVVHQWQSEGVEGTGLTIPEMERPMNHEARLVSDGSVWTLTKEFIEVDEYPIDERDPYTFGPALVSADVVVHASRDGALLQRVRMAEVLDLQRIGIGSADVAEGGGGSVDWSHANAVALVPGEDAVVVSFRHQDALVKLDASTGEPKWILGRHEGWRAPQTDLLLTPIGGEFMWPGHQHSPYVHPEDPSLITLFDNGNYGRASPYAPEPLTENMTRIVTYRVDDAAMTIEQVWEYRVTPAGILYSAAMGSVSERANGNFVLHYPELRSESGVSNADAGRGKKSIRVIELKREAAEVAFDMGLFSPAETQPDGWTSDRCVPSDGGLYLGLAEETVIPF